MKEIETNNYLKIAGKTERGKRDGTGPYEGSAQKSISDKGKRKNKGEKCPFKEIVEDVEDIIDKKQKNNKKKGE